MKLNNSLVRTLGIITVITLLYSLPLYSATSKYRLTVRDNGATSMVICWSDDDGDVGYSTTDHGTNYDAYPNKLTASQTVDKSEKGMNHHFARISGLTPDTVYYFVIRSGSHLSPRMSFRTLPSGTGFTMIAGGDSRTRPDVRRDGNRLVSKLRPRAILFCGDFIDQNTDSEWNEWLEDWQLTRSPDGRMQPVIPTLGNHEGYDSGTITGIFDAENAYFTVELGDMLVTALDSGGNVDTQANWMQSEMINHSDKRWRIVGYHEPMRPHSTAKGDRNPMYNAFAQLFYDYRVQLSVDGDTHVSKTTWPLRPDSGGEAGFVRDDEFGTVYTGEGSWAAPPRAYDNAKSWTRKGGSFAQFKWINVGSHKLTLRTVQFQNVANVGTVSDDNPYAAPSGIVLYGDDIDVSSGLPDPNESELISQSMPTAMLPGSTQEISISLKNTGEDPWSTAAGHKLRTENPADNDIWLGTSRVNLDHDVLPGQEYTFRFSVTAPTVTGNYPLRFRMVDDSGDNVGSFGAYTDDITVSVFDAQSGSVNSMTISATDDSEQRADGSVETGSSDLEFLEDNGGTQSIAVRFGSVNIPDDATVTNAYIQFTGDSSSGAGDGASMNINIRAHDVDDSPVTNTNANDVTSRVGTSAFVGWSPDTWTTGSGLAERTPDLSAVINEVTNRGDWNPGNAVTFIFTGSGALRRAESVNGDGGEEPKLFLEYSTPISNFVPAWNAPVISKSVASGTLGLSATLSTDISDDDPLSFTKISYDGGPGADWLTVSSDGTLGGSVPMVEGLFRWTVAASDTSHAPVTTILEVLVTGNGNNAPLINSVAVTGAVEGSQYGYSIEASDVDGDHLTYSVATIPSWLSFHVGARYLHGTPSLSDVGTHPVNINVSDGFTMTPHSFNIEVFESPQPDNYVINGSFEDGGSNPTGWNIGSNTTAPTEQAQYGGSALRVAAGASVTYQDISLNPNTDYDLSVWVLVSSMTGGNLIIDTDDKFDDASGPNGPGGDCQFVISGGAQSWIQYNGSFNSASEPTLRLRIFTGSMTGVAYVDNVRLSIVGSSTNVAPLITSNPITTVDANAAYSYQLTAADSNSDVLQYFGDSVPSWLHFNSSTALLIGAAGSGDSGDHVISLRVSDGVETVVQDFILTVVAAPDPYQEWKDNNGVVTDNGDDDGDGVVNILEYALSGNPQLADSGINLPQAVSNGTDVNFTFKRAEADLTYTVESSPDLQNWSVEATNPGNVGSDVTIPVSLSGVGNGRLFLRLRVND